MQGCDPYQLTVPKHTRTKHYKRDAREEASAPSDSANVLGAGPTGGSSSLPLPHQVSHQGLPTREPFLWHPAPRSHQAFSVSSSSTWDSSSRLSLLTSSKECHGTPAQELFDFPLFLVAETQASFIPPTPESSRVPPKARTTPSHTV